MLKVVYYSRACFLDQVMSEIRPLANKVKLFLVLEVSPEQWETNLLEDLRRDLPEGIHEARAFINGSSLEQVFSFWSGLAGFFLAIHRFPKTIHPRTWRVAWKTAKFIKRLEPDVLHLNDVSLRLSAGLPILRHIPTVLSVHDPMFHSDGGNWRSRLARAVTFRRAKRFILHNNAQTAHFSTQYSISEERINIIRLGVYDVYKEWGSDNCRYDYPRVLFFGRISVYKGIDIFIEAARKVSQEVSNVHFVIAGQPVFGFVIPELPILSNSCSFLYFPGYITISRSAELFSSSSLVVLPYRDATQSGVLLTAYAFGKPIIGTRVGGLPEYIKDGKTGRLVPPNDVGALAKAISDILLSPTELRRLSDNVRQSVVSEFSWDGIAEETLRVYNQTLDGANRRTE